jgi:hypothetical protein
MECVHVVARFCTMVKAKMLVIQGIRSSSSMVVLVSKWFVL